MKFKIQKSKVKSNFWLLAFGCLIVTSIFAEPSTIFKAMQDELQRTVTRLKLPKEKSPYYVSYRIIDEEKTIITGHLGAIADDDFGKKRYLIVDLRVGDFNFDNSNFAESPGFTYSSGDNIFTLPLDDDYDAIRHEIWLATDQMYKSAIDILSKKKSTLENKQVKDVIPDFSKNGFFFNIEDAKTIGVNKNQWKENIRTLTNIAKAYPKIKSVKATFIANTRNEYYYDSNASKYLKNNFITSIEISANTQNKEGISLNNAIDFCGHTSEDLPDINTMVDRVKSMLDTLTLYITVPEEEEYSGPVLFNGEASPQFFFELLGKGISDTRKPIYAQDAMAENSGENTGFLAGKINKSILPKSFSVEDNPLIKEFDNKKLLGNYSVDDQGVKPEKIEVVRTGKLINIPMSRTPTKEFNRTNGHGRYVGGQIRNCISNLIVKSNKTSEDLEKELITLVNEKELDYGIVIEKLAFQLPKSSDGIDDDFMYMFSGNKSDQPLLSEPLIAYKLYPNGKKELIRGLQYEGLTPMILRDIVLSGKDQTVYNLLYQDKIGNNYLPISIVSPSIIVERMTLGIKEGKAKKQPYLKHPYFAEK
jgi:predicted Zn-dependent protease